MPEQPAELSARPEGIAAVALPVEDDLRRLEAFLLNELEAFEPEVRPLVRYTLGHSGKKLRPLLVFFGAGLNGTPASEELLRGAAVVEFIHLATLVHDDILDEATLRHRTPTVSAKDGIDVAVLLGDAIFAHALKLASDFDTVDVCRVVSQATRQVCSGEISQCFARGETDLSIERYYRMIDLKTAELFAASAHIGAFLSGGDAAYVASVATFARELGIAYQVYDDVTDLLDREDSAGKTLGTDLESGKFTLPILLLLERLPEQEKEALQAELVSGDVTMDALIGQLEKYAVLPDVRQAFIDRLVASEKALKPYEGSEKIVPLLGLLGFISGAIDKYIPAS
jgi:octaprenyl-diphosphate synthase|tara:strand:+ start:101857 stop:102879 length:1023 start_codon:yes stop_codon:yes gene_type:complete